MRLERFQVGDELVKLGRKLNLLVDYCKAITPKSGENTRIRQTHAGAYISADKSPTGGAKSKADTYSSCSYDSESGQFTITLNERVFAYNQTYRSGYTTTQIVPMPLTTLQGASFVFDEGSSYTNISIYARGGSYKWRITSYSGTPASAANTATENAEVDLYDDLDLHVVTYVVRNGGVYSVTGNTIPDYVLDQTRQGNQMYFLYNGSSLLLFGVMNLVNASTGYEYIASGSGISDGDHTIYLVWSGTFWQLSTTDSGYSLAFEVGNVTISGSALTRQRTKTPIIPFLPLGVSGNKSFTDNAGRSHTVYVNMGIITQWDIS